MRKHLFTILLLLAATQASASEPFSLFCEDRDTQDGQPWDHVYIVDENAKTVDRTPAKFTKEEIIFQKGFYRFYISRTTGKSRGVDVLEDDAFLNVRRLTPPTVKYEGKCKLQPKDQPQLF